MNQTTITSPNQFRAWLAEHGYFEEGYCFTSPLVTGDQSVDHKNPESVRIELGYQIGGGWMAGETRIVRVFACTAYGVREWIPDTDADPYLDEGVTVIDHDTLLGLDLGPHGRIVCERFDVEQALDRNVPVEPTINRNAVAVLVGSGTAPTAQDWTNWFSEEKEDVIWRVYGGNEWQVNAMPPESYSGFLQRRRSIASTNGGIFVHLWIKSPTGFTIHLQNQLGTPEPLVPNLWQVTANVLRRFTNASFHSGNCVLSASQWDAFMKDGIVPTFVPANQ